MRICLRTVLALRQLRLLCNVNKTYYFFNGLNLMGNVGVVRSKERAHGQVLLRRLRSGKRVCALVLSDQNRHN